MWIVKLLSLYAWASSEADICQPAPLGILGPCKSPQVCPFSVCNRSPITGFLASWGSLHSFAPSSICLQYCGLFGTLPGTETMMDSPSAPQARSPLRLKEKRLTGFYFSDVSCTGLGGTDSWFSAPWSLGFCKWFLVCYGPCIDTILSPLFYAGTRSEASHSSVLPNGDRFISIMSTTATRNSW